MIGTKLKKNGIDWEEYKIAAEWCNGHNAWIVEYPDYYMIEDIPEKTWEELKTARLTELETSFNSCTRGSITTTQGYLMQFDITDSLKMQGAVQLLETTGATEGYLTQADDTTVYHVPLATMKAVLVEMLAAYAACHARKQELRAKINAAQDEEELDAVVISWPV